MKLTKRQLKRIIREAVGRNNFVVIPLYLPESGEEVAVGFPVTWMKNQRELLQPAEGENFGAMAPLDTPDDQMEDFQIHVSPKGKDQLESEGIELFYEGSHHDATASFSELLRVVGILGSLRNYIGEGNAVLPFH